MPFNQKPSLPFLAGVLASMATLASAGAQTVTVYETTADAKILLANQPSVSFGSSGGTSTITVNPNTKYQQMDGFGASMTDSSAYLISTKLTAAQQSSLMTWFFNNSTGIGLDWLRQPMGASDYSAQGNFSYDDMPSGQTDVSLNNFSIAKDLTYTIPLLKQALAINPNIKVQLLPWSPPAWMKTSGTMNGGNFNDSYYTSLGQYFVKTIQAYQAQGVPIYAIAAQNEPENSAGYPSESFSSGEEATFIGSYLGPALANAGLSPKILGYEHNWNDPSYPEAVLSNSAAYNAMAGTSWHGYTDPSGLPNQTAVQNAYPNKGQWFTEATGFGNGSFSGDLGWAMENLLIGSVRNYAKSVSEWNLALDQNYGPVNNANCTNCRGFVTINTSVSPATITYNVENYAYGHAAKFVTPGAYRVDSNSAAAGAKGVEDVAFQNPNGSMVLIAYNSGGSSATFNVNYAPNNTSFAYTLPGGAVATFTWTPGTTTTSTAPTAPSSLTATAASSSQINLGWTASSTSGATYSVYRSTTSGFAPGSSNLVASGLTGTTYSSTGLAASTAYYFVVQAVNSVGSSPSSNQASATTLAASTTSTGISTTAYYTVVNQASGACVDLTGGSTSNGTTLQQWACGSGNLNQQWKFTATTGSYYEVTPHASGTLAWDVTGVGTAPGSTMQLWTYGGGLNQQFQPVLQSSGYYTFIDHNSGLCLNVPSGATTNGLQLQINTCNGSTSEAFKLTQQ